MKSKVKISFGATGLFDLSKELLKSKTSSIFILVDSTPYVDKKIRAIRKIFEISRDKKLVRKKITIE